MSGCALVILSQIIGTPLCVFFTLPIYSDYFPNLVWGYPQLFSQIPSIRFMENFPLSPSIFHQRVTTFDQEQVHLRNSDHQKWIFVTNDTQLILGLTTASHSRNCWCCRWLHQRNGRVWMHGVWMHFYDNIHPVQGQRATQGRGLLRGVVYIRYFYYSI